MLLLVAVSSFIAGAFVDIQIFLKNPRKKKNKNYIIKVRLKSTKNVILFCEIVILQII